jgi:hypothetical protein
MKRGPFVEVSGKRYPTIIDDHGVQRFRTNKAVKFAIDAIDMNVLWMSNPPKNHLREMYRMIGYSVCGYAEIFPGDSISNPMWKKAKAR